MIFKLKNSNWARLPKGQYLIFSSDEALYSGHLVVIIKDYIRRIVIYIC
jgi:hypothetical protein